MVAERDSFVHCVACQAAAIPAGFVMMNLAFSAARPPWRLRAMIVGIPTEVKKDEYRVGMRPVGAEVLTKQGHTVVVQAGAGVGSGFPDQQYDAAGARIVPTAEEVWSRADLVVKVKEPQPQETSFMRENQTVFTYFHFAADRELTLACLNSKAICVAYETLTDKRGRSEEHTSELQSQ